MINGRTVLAIIPARGGSKRCPRKNIRSFRGKPLIAWTIEQGRQSKYIDSLVLSTEDAEIADVAVSLGVVTYPRPPYLATDEAKSEDVMRQVMSFFKQAHWIVLLQPTSPLRKTEDIDNCIEQAQISDTCETYGEDGKKNGAVYVARREWLDRHNFTDLDKTRYFMPDDRSLDIDTEEDLASVDYIRRGEWRKPKTHWYPYVLVSYQAKEVNRIKEVIESLPGDKDHVFLLPNQNGNEEVIQAIEEYADLQRARAAICQSGPNVTVHESLPYDEFLNLLQYCEEFIGNGPSILYEAPELGVKTRVVE